MNGEVRLYINNQEVELSASPDIKFTYQRTDYNNPTAVKVGYSKSISIEGTQNNDRIFNSMWDLNRIQNLEDPDYFNPSKRVPFQLFENGDLLEEGYVQLDSVKRTEKRKIYSVTLYAGLNDFLYGLSYKDNGNPFKLADLQYISPDDDELTFNINKDTVAAAWRSLHSNFPEKKWDIINFAPMYNGIPDNIDADKVLIDTQSVGGPSRIVKSDTVETRDGLLTSDGNYGTKNGYALGELQVKLTEWEMRDLRSYLQRPVYHIPALFKALQNFPDANANGYKLELDESFFNEYNPVYKNAWMTLPMLNNLKLAEESKSASVDITSTYQRGVKDYIYTLGTSEFINAGVNEASVSFDFYVNGDDRTSDDGGKFYPSFVRYYSRGYNTVLGGFTAQLLYRDPNGSYTAASEIYYGTNAFYFDNSLSKTNYETLFSSSTKRVNGYFTKTQTGLYKWAEKVKLTINNIQDTGTLVLRVTWSDNISVMSQSNRHAYECWLGVAQSVQGGWDSKIAYCNMKEPSIEGTASYRLPKDAHSGTKVTKQDLLSVDGTVADYLLSYCKLFDLYIEKDVYSKTVRIMQRQNWYSQYDSAVSLEGKVDYSKEMAIKPLSFDTKWYQFVYNGDDKSLYGNQYYSKWGQVFGSHRVDTGQEFNKEVNDLLKNNKFTNAPDVLESSRYFRQREVDTTNLCPTFMLDWLTYKLYNANNESKEYKIAGPLSFIDRPLNEYGQTEDKVEGWYDLFNKVEMRDKDNKSLDGVGVLLFYNGMKNTYIYSKGKNITVNYTLSDDIQEMVNFGGNLCWLYTTRSISGVADKLDQIPMFSRYYLPYLTSNVPTRSFYFGAPNNKANNPTPNLSIKSDIHIFPYYWQEYIEDLYDINTRIVECYVKLDEVKDDWFKRFYFFDGSYWVMTKITDLNYMSRDTVKCEFIKVQDPHNYHNGNVRIG